MTIQLGMVLDAIDTLDYAKDSSIALLLAAARQGWSLFYMTQGDLYQHDGTAYGRMTPLTVRDDPEHWYTRHEPKDAPLSALNIILMRKDPPVDQEYLYSTYLLEQAEAAGTLVVNKPQSLRDCNEKCFATQFPHCIPPTLISRNLSLIKTFAQEHGDIILKPLDGMGGTGVFKTHSHDLNLSVIIETLTAGGQQQIMAQRFIPDITQDGDKRILMINGNPVPYALARIPMAGELRGNLAAGGRGVGRPLTARDRWLADQVGPALRQKGLLFVGLDVIGDYLTEINVTSPTGIRELDNQFTTAIGDTLMAVLAGLVSH